MSPLSFVQNMFVTQEPERARLTSETPQSKSSSDSERPKPCCACPDTKRVRDDCFLRYGSPEDSNESTIKCADLIAAHKACMAQYGYQI